MKPPCYSSANWQSPPYISMLNWQKWLKIMTHFISTEKDKETWKVGFEKLPDEHEVTLWHLIFLTSYQGEKKMDLKLSKQAAISFFAKRQKKIEVNIIYDTWSWRGEKPTKTAFHTCQIISHISSLSHKLDLLLISINRQNVSLYETASPWTTLIYGPISILPRLAKIILIVFKNVSSGYRMLVRGPSFFSLYVFLFM